MPVTYPLKICLISIRNKHQQITCTRDKISKNKAFLVDLGLSGVPGPVTSKNDVQLHSYSLFTLKHCHGNIILWYKFHNTVLLWYKNFHIMELLVWKDMQCTELEITVGHQTFCDQNWCLYEHFWFWSDKSSDHY